MGALMLPPGIKEALDGLGQSQWGTQNASLLLKLIQRLHHSEGSAWATWAKSQTRLHSLQGDLAGTHWEVLRELLPAFRKITKVDVGD